MILIPLQISREVMSIPLLHGAGGAAYDELIIYGGIGALLIGLGFLAWKAGKEKDKRRRKRTSKR